MIANYILIFLILLVGWYAGNLPLKLSKNRLEIQKIDYFAKGAFFGLAIMHFLPEAIESANKADINILWLMLVVSVTTYIFQFSEQGVWYHQKKGNCKSHEWCSYVIFCVLIIHAFIEGGIAGIAKSQASFFIIAFSILAHKGAACLSLSNYLLQSGLSKTKVRLLITLFVFATPISIILCLILKTNYIDISNANYCWLYSVGAGTFLYVSNGCYLLSNKTVCNANKLPFVLSFGVGLFVIIILAAFETLFH